MVSRTLAPRDIQDELAKYEMPVARVGMPVIWYPEGIVNRNTKIALVESSWKGRSNVTLFVGGSHVPIREAVPHIDDPRLKLGNDHRENGAWDYTEEYKAQMKWKEGVEKRLAALEKKPTSK